MRVYALLLGIILTTGYAYAAQVAVSSVSAARHTDVAPAATIAAGEVLDRIWYGGTIDPIIVESEGAGRAPKTARTKDWLADRPALRCTKPAPSRHQAVL